MNFRRTICLILTVFMLTCFFAPPPVLAAEDELSIAGGSHSIDGKTPILGTDQLITNSAAVLLYEVNTDTLMYSWNADEELYPASLVKLMTALLVLEKGNLSDIVTVSANTVGSLDKGAVSADLKPSEVISVENLMYCMLVDSANDAALVLAEYVSGSQASFVEAMNQRALELGCTGTHFENAHGLHHENQKITARDVGRILKKLIEFEDFRTMFGTVNYTVPVTNLSDERRLETGNFLMNWNSMEIYHDARVTGGRTGVTTNGTRCIAATAEKDGLSFISVVMGAASEYEEDGNREKSFGGFPETTELLNLGFDGYIPAQIIYENQAIKQYPVANGNSDVVVCPRVSISTVLPRGTNTKDLSYRFHEKSPAFSAPIPEGEAISSVEIWNEGICLGAAELYTMHQVTVREQKESVPEENGSGTPVRIIWILTGAVGVLILMGVLKRVFLRRKLKAQRRRNRVNRRRSR